MPPIRIHINDYILLFKHPRLVSASKTPFNSMYRNRAQGGQKLSSKQIAISRTDTARSAIFIKPMKAWLHRILLLTCWTTTYNPSIKLKSRTTNCYFRASAAWIKSLKGNLRFTVKKWSKTREIWAWRGLSGSSYPRSTLASFRGVAQSTRLNQRLSIFSVPSMNAKESYLLATRVHRCSNKAVY